MHKYTKPTLHKLEHVYKELDYTVRYEKGTFKSGYCIVENSKVVVINKFFDTDARVGILMDILNDILTDVDKLSDKSAQVYRSLLKSHLNIA
ncbi:MAG TPA: hypothetical protein PK611_01105 [Saprospiraceae bacterium]|nr:hypothetical protein [Saprospiraceae bacterium]HRO09186.1 hypothetical protein [Saprospiraceae bacterium]HRO72247.1 hypothetical protein [Saprospiraceae bacterium]HRP42520.1 hypothetical protein [Saprospiraceae bacterium]